MNEKSACVHPSHPIDPAHATTTIYCIMVEIFYKTRQNEHKIYYMVMMTEYEKAIEFLKVGVVVLALPKFPRKLLLRCARLFKLIFLMEVMDGGSISASPRLKKKARINKR